MGAKLVNFYQFVGAIRFAIAPYRRVRPQAGDYVA